MDHVIDITICVNNDAFGTTYDHQAVEVARILRDAADRIEARPTALAPFGHHLCLNDINGNRVGSVTPNILSFS